MPASQPADSATDTDRYTITAQGRAALAQADAPAAYRTNRRRAYAIARELMDLWAISSPTEKALRAEQGENYLAGKALEAQLSQRTITRIDNEAHADAMPEWAAARKAGYRFTQPGRKANPWQHRTSGRVAS